MRSVSNVCWTIMTYRAHWQQFKYVIYVLIPLDRLSSVILPMFLWMYDFHWKVLLYQSPHHWQYMNGVPWDNINELLNLMENEAQSIGFKKNSHIWKWHHKFKALFYLKKRLYFILAGIDWMSLNNFLLF